MRWIRRHSRETAAIAACVGVVMIVAVLVVQYFTRGSSAPERDRSVPDFSAEPFDGADPATITRPPGMPAPASSASPGIPGIPGSSQGANAFGKPLNLPGLGGEGGVSGLPPHQIRLQLTSAVPISGVGYVIPTSLKDFYGVAEDIGKSWSLTTTVYGNPDYAQLFAQAGARGFPVTCTITVDGKVTERRSTAGPYGQLFCQG